jgi:hypothetical protein
MRVDLNLLFFAANSSAPEHGAEVIFTDTDFARFTEIRWRNPLDVAR